MKSYEIDAHLYHVLETKEDAEEVTDKEIEDALEWFADVRGVPTEDFIDKLCKYSRRYGEHQAEFLEIDQYDSEACKQILRRARKIKKEMDDYAS